jgi:hypothetical protein
MIWTRDISACSLVPQPSTLHGFEQGKKLINVLQHKVLK